MNNQSLSTAKCNVCGAIHREFGEIINGKFIVTEASMEWEFNDFPKTVFKAVLKRDKATGVYLCQKHDNRSQNAKKYRKMVKEKKLNQNKLELI